MKTKTTETSNAGLRVRTCLRGGYQNANEVKQKFFSEYPQCKKPVPYSDAASKCDQLLTNFTYDCTDRCNFVADCAQGCYAGAKAVRDSWSQ